MGYISWTLPQNETFQSSTGRMIWLRSKTTHAAFLVSKQYELLEHTQTKQEEIKLVYLIMYHCNKIRLSHGPSQKYETLLVYAGIDKSVNCCWLCQKTIWRFSTCKEDLAGHIFETSIKWLFFIPVSIKFSLCVLKTFLNSNTSILREIAYFPKKILRTCVNFWPINSKNEEYTSYCKI